MLNEVSKALNRDIIKRWIHRIRMNMKEMYIILSWTVLMCYHVHSCLFLAFSIHVVLALLCFLGKGPVFGIIYHFIDLNIWKEERKQKFRDWLYHCYKQWQSVDCFAVLRCIPETPSDISQETLQSALMSVTLYAENNNNATIGDASSESLEPVLNSVISHTGEENYELPVIVSNTEEAEMHGVPSINHSNEENMSVVSNTEETNESLIVESSQEESSESSVIAYCTEDAQTSTDNTEHQPRTISSVNHEFVEPPNGSCCRRDSISSSVVAQCTEESIQQPNVAYCTENRSELPNVAIYSETVLPDLCPDASHLRVEEKSSEQASDTNVLINHQELADNQEEEPEERVYTTKHGISTQKASQIPAMEHEMPYEDRDGNTPNTFQEQISIRSIQEDNDNSVGSGYQELGALSSSSIISSDGEYTSHTHVSEEFRPTDMTTTPTLQSSNPPDKSIKKQAGTKNWDRTKASRKKTDTGSLCPTRSNSNHSGGVVRLGQIKSDGDSQSDHVRRWHKENTRQAIQTPTKDKENHGVSNPKENDTAKASEKTMDQSTKKKE
uniref:Uncharacterized protein LOC111100418 isoform X3 n=1 Tax=Crassostrea virginica TaxID=6565 RepID=A0A8B8AA03_CRAVI|nr:uncharacterized protein LOC111100418 isoform X3 [Crassostrea virginica]